MKKVIPIIFLLGLIVISSTLVMSFAQMSEKGEDEASEQGQEEMSEKAQGNMTKQSQENTSGEKSEKADEVLASLDNFGQEVSDFVQEAMKEFKNQRQETVAQIQECRQNIMEADPSDRPQVRQDCRDGLDEIRQSYKDIRLLFSETFKEFRDSIKVLRDNASGHHVSDSDLQTAIDDIREHAKSKHMQEQQGKNGMDMQQFREKMKAYRGP